MLRAGRASRAGRAARRGRASRLGRSARAGRVVALLTAVAVQSQTSAHESVTIIRNPGQPDMEVVVREQGKEVRFKGAGSAAQGQGVRAGVAYKLEDGNIVYIPETGAAPADAGAADPAKP